MEFHTLDKKMIYRGSVFNVRQDRVRLPNGGEHLVDIVMHHPAVTLVPLDDQGMLWFIRQYRHAVRLDMLELPAGAIEDGESPQIGAQRELREEIGMAARNLSKIGEFYLAPGYSTEQMHVFLATDLYHSPLKGDLDEFLRIEKIPLEVAIKLCETGQLLDAKSLAAITLARRYLVP